MSSKRGKRKRVPAIVPRFLKRAVTIGVIPALAGGCEKQHVQPPVVAYFAPKPYDTTQPPVVAAYQPAAADASVDARPVDAAAPQRPPPPVVAALVPHPPPPPPPPPPVVAAMLPPPVVAAMVPRPPRASGAGSAAPKTRKSKTK